MIIHSQNLFKTCYFLRVAVKLRLVMPKTNEKDKIGDQKNLLVNFIFLKVVSNIRDAFGTFYTIN